MKAMIFAAGLGTRLRPLTNDRPKAMVLFKDKPLIHWTIERLVAAGVQDIIVNVHHFADVLESYLLSNRFDANIHISDERGLLLDTGGGLKKAAHFFKDDQPFFVINVDVLTTLDLNSLYQYHINSQALATLAVQQRKSSRVLLFDANGILSGWRKYERSTSDGPSICQAEIIARPIGDQYNEMAFSGIHVISPTIFQKIHQSGVFSIIDTYLALASAHTIKAFDHSGDTWIDVGKPENLVFASSLLTL